MQKKTLENILDTIHRSFGNHLTSCEVELPNNISGRLGNCHKTISQSDRLFAMATAPGSISKLASSDLGMDPSTFISRMIDLKHIAIKIIMRQMNSLTTSKLNWTNESERSYSIWKTCQ